MRLADEAATARTARALAMHLRAGDIIGLVGELGSGKTTFVRGLALGLGIDPRRVRSPTFTLINEYSGGALPVYHLDLYRLEPSAVDRVALREYLYGDGVCAIEWMERLGEEPPRLSISLEHAGDEQRILVVQAVGPGYERLLVPEIWDVAEERED